MKLSKLQKEFTCTFKTALFYSEQTVSMHIVLFLRASLNVSTS